MNDHNALINTEYELSDLTATVVSIPDGERVEPPILICVESKRDTPLSDDSPVVTVSDRNGNIFEFNVWKDHIKYSDWEINHWYILRNVRGHVWRTKKDEIKRQLTTTSNTIVFSLGYEINPPPVNKPPKAHLSKVGNSRSYPHNIGSNENVKTHDEKSEEPVSDRILEGIEENSILEEISDEFDL